MSIQNPDVYSKKIAEKFSEFYLRKLFRSDFFRASLKNQSNCGQHRDASGGPIRAFYRPECPNCPTVMVCSVSGFFRNGYFWLGVRPIILQHIILIKIIK